MRGRVRGPRVAVAPGMYLVEFFLPLHDRTGVPFEPRRLRAVRDALVERFGGVTVQSRAPAQGLWQDQPGDAPERDDVIRFEVIVPHLDRTWWREWRARLEREFGQEQVMVRATLCEIL